MYLTDIIIYPVKSLGGIHLTKSLVQREGLQYDRRWMLLDENGGMLTQRMVPEMALIIPEVRDGRLSFYHAENKSERVTVSLDATDGPGMSVQVWKDQVAARPVDKKVDEWFGDVFKFKCELVRIEENAMRYDMAGAGGKYVSFADSQPFLIIGENSLADLNSRLETPVPMNRFRPNFVFSGGEPYIEDTWDEYQIGNVVVKNMKPCGRCVLTTVDQKIGKKTSVEPLRTLSTYRKNGKNVDFGMRSKLGEGQDEAIVKIGYGINVMSYKD